MFLCCHPALSADSQIALTLRLLGGLDTDQIANAFLVIEPTIARRIVRAKRKLRDNHATYRIPRQAGDSPQHALIPVDVGRCRYRVEPTGASGDETRHLWSRLPSARPLGAAMKIAVTFELGRHSSHRP
jgi:RNA polymerase sigma-70 factor, ECF subfamily